MYFCVYTTLYIWIRKYKNPRSCLYLYEEKHNLNTHNNYGFQRYTHISTKCSETTLCVLYECYLVTDRRVSCKDLGKGDCEGWLLKRKTKGTILPHSHWHRRWCVIKDYNLYCFHEREVSDEKFNKNKVFKIKPNLTQRQWNLDCVWSTMFITALSVVQITNWLSDGKVKWWFCSTFHYGIVHITVLWLKKYCRLPLLR